MTPEQIEQMREDMKAGTPGPWAYTSGSAFSIRQVNGPYIGWVHLWDVTAKAVADCNRFARVPDMEAEILRLREVEQAQAAEIARLRDALKKLDVGEGWAAQIARAALNGKSL